MFHGPKPGGDSLICPNLKEDLVASPIPRGASPTAHREYGEIF